MIHTTTASGKFRRLVRKLRPLLGEMPVSVDLVATGLLERIWHIGISEAHRGDIGSKLDNEEIAEMIGWHGDADAIIALLVSEKWLDEHPVHRLLIHDWHIHAPRHVKGNAAKSGGFLTHEGTSLREAPNDAKEAPLGTHTKPNLTKPNNLASQDGVAGGVSYEETVVGEDLWESVLPQLQITKTELFNEPPLSLDDRESLIRNVLVAMHYLEDGALETIRGDGAKLRRRNKLTNPMGYVCKCVSNACMKRGVDSRLASQSFCIPDKYLNPPKPP